MDDKITIIYEDDHVVVINKPAGLVVHGDGKTDEPTLVDWVRNTFPEIGAVGEPLTVSSGVVIERPGIVHRLDRETSGVLIIVKDQETFFHLKTQFQERTVEKTYNAFVHGVLKEASGVIDRPIGKSTKDFRRWSAQPGARGTLRDAVTEYRVVEQGRQAAFVEVRPRTGRTHQIRVHFKAIHHPVVCDTLYAPRQECLLGFTRLALHARQLSFKLTDGTVLTAEAPLPDDFRHALTLL